MCGRSTKLKCSPSVFFLYSLVLHGNPCILNVDENWPLHVSIMLVPGQDFFFYLFLLFEAFFQSLPVYVVFIEFVLPSVPCNFSI